MDPRVKPEDDELGTAIGRFFRPSWSDLIRGSIARQAQSLWLDPGSGAGVTGKVLRRLRPFSDCHVWTAPFRQGQFAFTAFGSGAVMYPAFVCGSMTAGPEGVRGSASNHPVALGAR